MRGDDIESAMKISLLHQACEVAIGTSSTTTGAVATGVLVAWDYALLIVAGKE